jgi:hypothetical protein
MPKAALSTSWLMALPPTPFSMQGRWLTRRLVVTMRVLDAGRARGFFLTIGHAEGPTNSPAPAAE